MDTEPNTNKKKVLVVEDDESLLSLLTNSLKSDGFDVLTAINGIEGLKLAQEELPDLIILDLEMPGMKGLEVLEKLRANEETKNMKIIVLSNIADTETVSKILTTGQVHNYLAKTDLELEDIVKNVKDVLEIK